jgi:hypothetical protein
MAPDPGGNKLRIRILPGHAIGKLCCLIGKTYKVWRELRKKSSKV